MFIVRTSAQLRDRTPVGHALVLEEDLHQPLELSDEQGSRDGPRVAARVLSLADRAQLRTLPGSAGEVVYLPHPRRL